MLVDAKAVAEVYRDLQGKSSVAAAGVLLLVANDTDSLCAARMLQVRSCTPQVVWPSSPVVSPMVGCGALWGAAHAAAQQHACYRCPSQTLLNMDGISFRITPVAGYLDFRKVFQKLVRDDEGVSLPLQQTAGGPARLKGAQFRAHSSAPSSASTAEGPCTCQQ